MKTIRHHIRGAIYGSLATILIGAWLLHPYTKFSIQTSNIPAEQLAAENTSVSLAQIMPKVILPPVKPKEK